MKIGYIHSDIIGHKRFTVGLKYLCEQYGHELYVESLHKYYVNDIAKYRDCDLVIDENRLYKRIGNQKIVYWYTGSGDLSTYARDARQTYPWLDYVITPFIRDLDNKKYSRYKMIGNPMVTYFHAAKNFIPSDFMENRDSILVPQERCYDMKPILDFAKMVAEKEGLKLLCKERDNSEHHSKIFEYFSRAKYIIAGFSSMAFEGLYFGIPFVLVSGLNPNIGNPKNKLFYGEVNRNYNEVFAETYGDFRGIIDTVDYGKIRSEHWNDNFERDFLRLVGGQ